MVNLSFRLSCIGAYAYVRHDGACRPRACGVKSHTETCGEEGFVYYENALTLDSMRVMAIGDNMPDFVYSDGTDW